MQQDKVKIKLSGIPASMLGCLWGRAQVSKEYSSLFYDEKAIELAEKIDYDFSTNDAPFEDIWFSISSKVDLPEFGLMTLRARQFDEKAKKYIEAHPRASVVNLGAGLDTTFYRVDNGLIHWYDLDLPEVIDVRRQLLPEPDRVTYIAKSIFDPSWCKDINTENGVFMIAGGIFMWFERSQVQEFFSMLADNFPGGEMVFNFRSGSDDSIAVWMDMFPPERLDAMRAAWVEGLKIWWENASQDQKDELMDVIAELKTPTKPNGKEWADVEGWWSKLSDEKRAGIMADFMTFFRGGVGMWALEDASEITKWDSRISVIDQLPMFKNISRESLSAEIRRVMDYSDERTGASIIHCEFDRRRAM
jgi:O-methyltransferase involved in polyketide biosynthesis